MSHHKKHSQRVLNGTFQNLIYSPNGAIEGLLLDVSGEAAQLVVDPHEHESDEFDQLRPGQAITVDVEPMKDSPKGEAVHSVYRLEAVLSINGAPRSSLTETPNCFKGTVIRFNFARHGEPNGVILDTGDFVHLKPDGMSVMELKVGDQVEARGKSRPLATGRGRVIEAREVNGWEIVRS